VTKKKAKKAKRPIRDRASYMRWYRAARKFNDGNPLGRDAGRFDTGKPWES
jgi:hypothetical protein